MTLYDVKIMIYIFIFVAWLITYKTNQGVNHESRSPPLPHSLRERVPLSGKKKHILARVARENVKMNLFALIIIISYTIKEVKTGGWSCRLI